jgi:hypothetical protein
MQEAIAAASRVDELDRGRVRDCFLRRFTSRRMAEDYLELYQSIVRNPDSKRLSSLGTKAA